MKKITYTTFIILALAAAVFAPTPTKAAGESGTVTGAARATFAQGATLGSVALSGFDLGTGVFIESDGSGFGVFSAVLTGRSLTGQDQQITVDGSAGGGAIGPDGLAYFSGTATVNFENGMPSLSGVPFSVSTTADSLVLTINSTTLPAARVIDGTISIE